MSKDTGSSKSSATEMGLTLEELIRRGAELMSSLVYEMPRAC